MVKGAGQEHSPERPRLSIAHVEALTLAMPEPWRIAVSLAAWCQLRRGEVLGLERRDVDMVHGSIRVERTANDVKGGIRLGPPKTQAGIRTVSVPPNIVPALEHHLDGFVAPDPQAPLLVGPEGG
jgi:integrase